MIIFFPRFQISKRRTPFLQEKIQRQIQMKNREKKSDGNLKVTIHLKNDAQTPSVIFEMNQPIQKKKTQKNKNK